MRNREAWEDAKSNGFDEANGFASENYNVNLEQFFPENR